MTVPRKPKRRVKSSVLLKGQKISFLRRLELRLFRKPKGSERMRAELRRVQEELDAAQPRKAKTKAKVAGAGAELRTLKKSA